MLTRRVAVLVATLGVAALPMPVLAGDPPPQRRLVFHVHQDTTSRTVVRQETDVSSAFNSRGPLPETRSVIGQESNSALGASVGGGGQTASGLASTAVDKTIGVDVILVAADGSLGCDVWREIGGVRTAPARVWIAPDGRTSWKGAPADADPAVAFLLPMLASQFIPPNTEVGGGWQRQHENYNVQTVKGNVALLKIDGTFGEPSHGGNERGSIQYDVAKLVPSRVELDVHSHLDFPMHVTTTDQHVTVTLVSDSLAHRS